MTKALRITSIIVAAVAVLLVALPAVFSSRMDEQAQSLLNMPGVLESLQKTGVADTGAVSPLVQQAQKFAELINPKPPSRPSPPPKRTSQTPVRPMAPVSAKFDLLGTSYYPLRPEMSLALIDEPGKGLRWIRQSSTIGHLVVDEVKDGTVIIRDGARTYELEPKRASKRSLIKGESSHTTEVSSSLLPSTTQQGSPSPRSISPRISARNRRIPVRAIEPQPLEELNSAQEELLEQFTRETENIDDPNEWLKIADEFMERMSEASQVTDDEAAMLDKLGKEMQDANQESNEP